MARRARRVPHRRQPVATDTSSVQHSPRRLAAGSHYGDGDGVRQRQPALSTTSLGPVRVHQRRQHAADGVTLTAPTNNQSSRRARRASISPRPPAIRVARSRASSSASTARWVHRHHLAVHLHGDRSGCRRHTRQATAFDNGSPALSTVSATVSFTIGRGRHRAARHARRRRPAVRRSRRGSAVRLAATASDPGGAVIRVGRTVARSVERHERAVQLQRHGLATGSHTRSRRRVHHGSADVEHGHGAPITDHARRHGCASSA